MMKLSIYIPSAVESSELWVNSVLRDLSRQVGGASMIRVEGCWLNAFEVLIAEPVAVVYTYVSSEQALAVSRYLEVTAKKIAVALHQEAVLVVGEPVSAFKLVTGDDND